MNTPRPAFLALISALAAAPALSSAAPTPIPMGPAGPGECVIGSPGCGVVPGSALDPVAEGALAIDIGRRVVLPLGGEKRASRTPAKAARVPEPGPETDLAALGQQLINPPGGAPLSRAASVASARQATFDTHADGSITPAEVPNATNLSYIRTQQIEKGLNGEKIGTAFGSDPKLSSGDAGFAPGGFGASENSR